MFGHARCVHVDWARRYLLVNLLAVGQNLQDHPFRRFSWSSNPSYALDNHARRAGGRPLGLTYGMWPRG